MKRRTKALLATVFAAAIGSAIALSPIASGQGECPNQEIREQQGSTALPDCRAYELVTPADKSSRRGGDPRQLPEFVANPGVPSADGDAITWFLQYGLVSGSSGVKSTTTSQDVVTISRQNDSWTTQSLYNRVHTEGGSFPPNQLRALSPDHSTSAWWHTISLFPQTTESMFSVRRNDASGPDADGWHDWATPHVDLTRTGDSSESDRALIGHNDRMVRWGYYYGMNGPSDPSNQQLPYSGSAQKRPGGHTVYMQQPAGSGPRELVNGCTGSNGSATMIPRRDDSGTSGDSSDDVLSTTSCEEGQVVSVRGAMAGGPSQTTVPVIESALSDDGARVFFSSPDPESADLPDACTTSTGDSTDCPPQLFVRQWTTDGEATVRWLSRPEIQNQEIDLLGGAYFEGASVDGKHVFFRTNTPLTDDDPNGQATAPEGGVSAGTASDDSWDLYRFTMAGDRDIDPVAPDESQLLRITGGPNGASEPNLIPTTGGTSTRFVSDDGSRIYFVTSEPIGSPTDSWNEPPDNGNTAPGSGGNLYLFDANASGDDRYQFIAQLPTGGKRGECAAVASPTGAPRATTNFQQGGGRTGNSCVRGSSSGDAVVFESPGALTNDDGDTATDIFLYEAASNSLTRVSAPEVSADPFACQIDAGVGGGALEDCNGSLGHTNKSAAANFGLDGFRHSNLSEDAEGQLEAIYFESQSPLIAEDANEHYDVYEWRDDELRLISPGNTSDHAWYSGNSLDGEDVFIFTSATLDPQREVDPGDHDIYDARAGGGLPPLPDPVVPCDVLADECQQPGPAPPEFENPGSIPSADASFGSAVPPAAPSTTVRCRPERDANSCRENI